MMFQELQSFFQDNDLAKKAASSLGNGRQIAVVVTDGESTFPYTFTKDGGRNVFKNEPASSPDVTFTMPIDAAKEIVATNFDSVGQVGLRIFEKIISSDPKQKIAVKVHAGFLSLLGGGYLGVIAAGGADVAKFLASKGLSDPGKIKNAISKLKG